MEQMRQERVREQDIFNLNIARMKNEYVAKLKEIEMREREMTLREKEGKKLNRKLKILLIFYSHVCSFSTSKRQ